MAGELDLSGSREGLLRNGAATLSRDSFDEYSSSEGVDLDELDRLEGQPAQRPRGGWLPLKRKKKDNGKGKTQKRLLEATRKGGWFRTKTCWLVSAILSGGLLILLFGIKKFAFKKAQPMDGLSPPWYPSPKGGTLSKWQKSYLMAATLVSKMSLVEKVNVTTGTGWASDLCVGNTAGAFDAGFPPLCLQDGPLGIRFSDHSTAWPAGITVGATWNKDLMYRRGRGLGLEYRLKGVNVMLGPAMGPLGRMPGGGRNWEGFGSDPVLQGIAAAQTIRGIQDEGVIATAKHWVGNEQEHFRQPYEWGLPHSISTNIDDRTLHELYLWPFADSVRAGVGSVMCSYNMVNESYACANSKLLNGILKDELGFQGFVQSDWLAQRSGVASALAGLDMTMPGDGLKWADGQSLWGPRLTEAVLNGSVPIERINDMVLRIAAVWYQLGQDNQTQYPVPLEGNPRPNFSSWTDEKMGHLHESTDDDTLVVINNFTDVQGEGENFHGRLAQEIAAEGTVLVKNEGNILPLSPSGGPEHTKNARRAKYNVGVFGEDAGPNPKGPNACPDRACNEFTLGSGWGSGAVEFPFLTPPIQGLESAFDLDQVHITQVLTNDVPDNWPTIHGAQDLCIVFITADAGEGFETWNHVTDRIDLHPQKSGDDLVKKVAVNCANTVVVIHAVGAVILERWIDLPNVRAVVLANLPGEESGNALADVLFGRIDASGRLPYTVGKSLADYGPGAKIMAKPNGLVPHQDFKEGLFIDYRHFDANSISPRYEFGFGLSYTTFSFSDLQFKTLKSKSPLPSPRPDPTVLPPTFSTLIPDPETAVFPAGFRRLKQYIYPYLTNTTIKSDPYPYPNGYNTPQNPSQAGGGDGGNPSLYDEHLSVSVTVTNTGKRTGKQVVQVYVSFPSNIIDASTGKQVDFPVRVLRGFEKVEIKNGNTTTVEMKLTRRDLSYWSVGRQNWVMPDGDFTIAVGASSRDLPLTGVW